MTVTLDMPKDIEAQFAAAAKARGMPLSDYVRDFIVEHYQEEADDLRTAQERQADPQPALTSTQLRKKLWLGRLNRTHRSRKTSKPSTGRCSGKFSTTWIRA